MAEQTSTVEQISDVDRCDTHEGDLFVQGCAGCTTEDEMKMVALKAQSDRITRIMDALAQDGVQVPQTHILSLRLEMLIEHMVQDRARYAFEGGVLDAMLVQLHEAQAEVRKQMLAPQGGGLIVPKGRG